MFVWVKECKFRAPKQFGGVVYYTVNRMGSAFNVALFVYYIYDTISKYFAITFYFWLFGVFF